MNSISLLLARMFVGCTIAGVLIILFALLHSEFVLATIFAILCVVSNVGAAVMYEQYNCFRQALRAMM